MRITNVMKNSNKPVITAVDCKANSRKEIESDCKLLNKSKKYENFK